MRVWKEPSAYSDKQQGNGGWSRLQAEIIAMPSLDALSNFEAEWIGGRYRLYPQTWLVAVQEECAIRRADLVAEGRMRTMDKMYQSAMDRDGG
jgi:hypothetical protein